MKKIFFLLILVILTFPILVESAQVCGDGKCLGTETCSNCPQDCGACPAVCGDGSCNGDETCSSCLSDCGACSTTTPTQTGTATSGAATKPLHIFPEFPLNYETIKRGQYKFKVKLLYAGSEIEEGRLVAKSDLFELGEISFKPDRAYCGMGCWTAEVDIGKDIKKGQYIIKYSARHKTDENELVNSISVNPDLNITLKNSLETNYSKGKTISFEGRVTDYSGKPANNSNFKIKIYNKGTKIFEKRIKINLEGEFRYDYFIDFADQEGIWDILLEAKDGYENYGLLNFKPNIKTPSGTIYYTINFLSPLKDFYYKKGDIITINVELKENDLLISNAKLEFVSPTYKRILLNEIGQGIYAGEYKIDWNDPTDIWNLKVGAEKVFNNKTKVGGSYIPINIQPGEIKLDIIEPASNTFYPSVSIKFKIKATQSDGSISQGSKINVNFSNGKEIKLIESAPGIYTGEYIPNSEDIGTLKMNIVAKDLYENKGEILDTIIYIKQTSIIETGIFLFYQYIIRRYWWGILLFLIIAGILYKPSIEIDYLSKKLRRVKKEIKIINEMQVAAEKKYYKERSISRDEFLELMREYEKRMAKSQETERITRGTLNNKIEKTKKTK